LPLAKDLDGFTFAGRRSIKAWSVTWQPASSLPSSATPCWSGEPASRIWPSLSREPAFARDRGRFYIVVDLVNRLESEARAGRQDRLADYLTRMDFVVLDELGYLPFAQTGGQLLFHLISRLYERTSSSPPISPSANGRASLATPK
jgi:hypothetical protein